MDSGSASTTVLVLVIVLIVLAITVPIVILQQKKQARAWQEMAARLGLALRPRSNALSPIVIEGDYQGARLFWTLTQPAVAELDARHHDDPEPRGGEHGVDQSRRAQQYCEAGQNTDGGGERPYGEWRHRILQLEEAFDEQRYGRRRGGEDRVA